MATVTSPIKLKGAIGDLVIASTQAGGQRAYLKAQPDKKKWYRTKRFTLCGYNAQEFGGAAMCGSAIYDAIRYKPSRELRKAEPAFVPYAHNRIAKRLRRHADRRNGFCTHYHFAAAMPALHGLDLSPEGSPTKSISLLPIGPNHAPTHIRIQGLRAAAEQIPHLGNARLECRISIRNVAFPEVSFDEKTFKWAKKRQGNGIAQHQTLWFPIDIVPAEGIKVELPEPQESATPEQSAECPTLHFAIIQWRIIQHNRKPKHLKGHNIIRFAAATDPSPEAAKTVPNLHKHTNQHYIHRSKLLPAVSRPRGASCSLPTPKRKPLREALPNLYLRIALMGTKTNLSSV